MEVAMEIGTVSSWAQVVLASFGFLIAWVQWRNHKQIVSAKHISEVLSAFCSEKIRMSFCKYVDRCKDEYYKGPNINGEPEFNAVGTLTGDEVEVEVDNMLLVFENICYQAHNSVIQADAFKCFEYQIRMTLSESQIQRYLADLARYCSKNEGGFPFLELISEGAHIGSLSIFYLDVQRRISRR